MPKVSCNRPMCGRIWPRRITIALGHIPMNEVFNDQPTLFETFDMLYVTNDETERQMTIIGHQKSANNQSDLNTVISNSGKRTLILNSTNKLVLEVM